MFRISCVRFLLILLNLSYSQSSNYQDLKMDRVVEGHSSITSILKISPDQTVLAFNVESNLYLYDFRTKKITPFGSVGERLIRDIAFSPDSKKLASMAGTTVTVWDATSKDEIMTFTRHEADIEKLQFIDNETLVTMDSNDLILAWNYQTNTLKWHLIAPENNDSGMTISPNGTYLITDDSSEATLFNLEEKNLLGKVRDNEQQRGTKLLQPQLYSKDERSFYALTRSNKLKRFDLNTGQELEEVIFGDANLDYSFIPEHKQSIYLIDTSQSLWKYDLNSNQALKIAQLDSKSDSIRMYGFQINEQNNSIIYDTDAGIHIMNLESQNEEVVTIPSLYVDQIAYIQNGQFLATSKNNQLILWNTQPLSQSRTFELPFNFTKEMTFEKFRGINYLFIHSGNAIIMLNPLTGQMETLIQAGGFGLGSMDFSEDGRYLAIGETSQVSLWDLNNPVEADIFREDQTRDEAERFFDLYLDQWDVKLSQDSKWLATRGVQEDRSQIILWEIQNKNILASLSPLDDSNQEVIYSDNSSKTFWSDQFVDMEFNQHNQLFASMQVSGLRLYDPKNQEDLWQYTEEGILSFVLSPNKLYLAAITEGSDIVIIDAQTGELQQRIEGHSLTKSLAFSPDGQTLIIGSGSKEQNGSFSVYTSDNAKEQFGAQR